MPIRTGSLTSAVVVSFGFIALMMEAVQIYETLVTRRYNPEDSQPQILCLKHYFIQQRERKGLWCMQRSTWNDFWFRSSNVAVAVFYTFWLLTDQHEIEFQYRFCSYSVQVFSTLFAT
jgi:hypothetical protein